MKTTKGNLIILYEDNHLIAVYKRPGDISQADKTGDQPLGDIVKDFIKERDHKPGNVFMGVIHRIDRPTYGVILFAKTSKALERMTVEFAQRRVNKTYWAIVEGKPKEKEKTIRNFLWKNQEQNRSYVVSEKKPGAKEAVSHYKVLSEGDNYSLLEIQIETGRHHQIRTHLSDLGHPIKGDVKYGAKRANKFLSIDLLAREVNFIHPIKKEPIQIIANPPDEKIWQDLTSGL
ncbi:MAG: RluA family pseudouridine synthase [Crocinitomicaceae bacterium]|nr:RluA family pseudouridine synthase [Crocinitomicaceae bacterium]